MKAYGAEFVLVDSTTGFAGVIGRVNELAKLIPNSHVLNQASHHCLHSYFQSSSQTSQILKVIT